VVHEGENAVSVEPEKDRTEAGTDERRGFVVMSDRFIYHRFDFSLVRLGHDVSVEMGDTGIEPVTPTVSRWYSYR
jgi:hypothetical protein